MGERRCRYCGDTKALSEFVKDWQAPRGVTSKCLVCERRGATKPAPRPRPTPRPAGPKAAPRNVNTLLVELHPDWHGSAACVGKTSVMYGNLDESPSARTRRLSRARRLCTGCTVHADCLTEALALPPEPPGVVRAGLLADEVDALRRESA